MKQIVLTMITLFCLFKATYGQLLKPSILNSAGSFAANGNVQLEWSLGEPGTASVKNDYAFLTQGFLQPNAGTTTIIPVVNLPILCGGGLDNAGANFSSNGSNVLLSFTLGEMASRTLVNNHLLTQGILQPLPVSAALPVSALEFFAKRLTQKDVALEWSTRQEYNNAGFMVERRLAGENDFKVAGWVMSKALNGTGNAALYYNKLDSNAYPGNSFYRLKQVDKDGNFTYSPIRVVQGTMNNTVQLAAWPIPAPGDFFISISGTSEATVAICDAAGKIIRELPVRAGVPVKILGLPAGIYFMKTKEHLMASRKIVVQ